MIAFENVTYDYPGVTALRDVTLSLDHATTTALIGPSGCGKSTLIKIAVGLLIPSRGQVRIGEQALESAHLAALRHRIGYVIQSGGLFPHLTARENVTLCARHLRRPAPWIAERFQALAELVRLPGDLLDRYPGQLSGGQRQRVSVMRALMLDPDVLLLDEPLGALDPMVRHELQQDLRALFDRLRKTVVLVTHDLAEAAFFSDSIVLMREGRIVQRGTHADLQRAPADAFVRAFLAAQQPLPPLHD
ncbi:osmoprotectant transport system ATP-binding protein [Panacagrimonas perspica]|uniref:Osmoprotectant transport system ATP-binding protein n=1 Tax=Panacagrimonas perspica TaxID=381431 RepID=A0A4S3KBD9_9GAMM|nr:ATP-binding cassette domain-containing protein [Panacagrimonas perspica]TDU32620.1 osmoprotectant transport system ATP-binding protein [Panacagrimonas perspica]THD05508.1 ABC transporter ATP-binding protein [Panacagrimonas perspica]